MKYERFDPILEQCETVRLKDGGGIRYIDVETSTVITFKEIRETATHLYFVYLEKIGKRKKNQSAYL